MPLLLKRHRKALSDAIGVVGRERFDGGSVPQDNRLTGQLATACHAAKEQASRVEL